MSVMRNMLLIIPFLLVAWFEWVRSLQQQLLQLCPVAHVRPLARRHQRIQLGLLQVATLRQLGQQLLASALDQLAVEVRREQLRKDRVRV